MPAPVYGGRSLADSLALASIPVAPVFHPFAIEKADNVGADCYGASDFHKVAVRQGCLLTQLPEEDRTSRWRLQLATK